MTDKTERERLASMIVEYHNAVVSEHVDGFDADTDAEAFAERILAALRREPAPLERERALLWLMCEAIETPGRTIEELMVLVAQARALAGEGARPVERDGAVVVCPCCSSRLALTEADITAALAGEGAAPREEPWPCVGCAVLQRVRADPEARCPAHAAAPREEVAE